MSMELLLAHVDPGWIEAIRAEPQLVRTLFWEEGPELPGPFDAEKATFEEDYRMLKEVVDTYAATGPDAAAGTAPALATAIEPDGDTLDFPFTYGDAVLVSPARVAEIAGALAAERAALPVEMPVGRPEDVPDGDSAEPSPELVRWVYGEYLAMVGDFYAAAAARGSAVVSGVT